MSFSVFSQNPTVINDSLIVNQRLYAKEKLIVDLEAKFKQDIKVQGSARINTDVRIDGELRVDGTSKLNGNVKLNNIALTTLDDTALKVLLLHPNGNVMKVSLHGLSAIPDNLPIYCPPGENIPNPYWQSGLNKIFVQCPPVNVGISTANPMYKLHVEGNGYFQKLLSGNSTGSLGAVINGFAKNDLDRLIYLGVKIGSGAESVRFSISNNGNVQIYNVASAPSLTINNGTGHAVVIYDNGGTKILQVEDNGLLRTRELRIDATNWADFVFDESYDLPELNQVAAFIEENHRLPGVPSSEEIKKNGINVAEMHTLQMQKIEELTLYIIEMNQKMEELQSEVTRLKQENQELKKSETK
jgi:hypothetical protein